MSVDILSHIVFGFLMQTYIFYILAIRFKFSVIIVLQHSAFTFGLRITLTEIWSVNTWKIFNWMRNITSSNGESFALLKDVHMRTYFYMYIVISKLNTNMFDLTQSLWMSGRLYIVRYQLFSTLCLLKID